MSSRRGPGRPAGAPAPRREQLIDVTIDLVSDQGYAAATLGRIAAAAGLSKASVLHHYPSVVELVGAAYQHVLASMVSVLTAALEPAAPADRPLVYVTATVGYFRDHPRHTRMISEALVHLEEPGDSRGRQEALAELLDEARAARGLPTGQDLRTAAVITGGAIDGIVREQLADPTFDTSAAAADLAAALEMTVLSPLEQALR
ncbi:TetR/AcrR family transcriptional regulator [Brachybacterium sp. FME24]|uniref:TetR/AcrR family transcriptional regulator n=1 Tax=Brachybacterium sp. FME24 TaxID=2742605 RepID=UPI00186787CB|nr:TetR/AcrR family transcriptional regulator [Brachybacterium sp. FME24]